MSTSRSQVPSDEPRVPCLSFLLLLNALALVLVAVWFRGQSLENIPGVNGDEAWYGVQAWQMLHGGADGDWHTPTGNPINPLFLGPVALLLTWLPPSITLLRSVALASGLVALAINWFCCRWVFDRPTAWISTAALAVLPIDIAYSRFAWDASQSLAATLPVAYFTLAATRFPHHFGRWMAAAVLALAIAVWVHPTNIFAGAVIAIALARRYRQAHSGAALARISCVVMLLAAALLIAVWVWAARPGHGPLPGRMERWWGNVLDLPHAAVLFPRLFTGGTIYRFTAGSQSWFEWPLPAGCDGPGLDVALFWAVGFGSAWMLWRSRLRFRTDRDDPLRLRAAADAVLLAAWTLEFVAFQLVAGAGAMAPGQERFAICLIGPTVLLGARGAALAWEAASTRWRVALALAALAGWPVLADFHAQYFRFIERTGGQAHLTFRTGPIEPKQAALAYILQEAGTETPAAKAGAGDPSEIWIVCSEWWNRWPLRYLAIAHRAVRVVDPAEAGKSDDCRQARIEGRVWFVEFCGTDAQRGVESQLADRKPTRQEFLDYAGRPVVCVMHSPAE